MFDPFSDSIFVRGEVVGKDISSLKIVFKKSSVLWDESDIATAGEQVELSNVKNTSMFNVGDEVIGYGQLEKRGAINTTQVYLSYFQPFGIDWKVSFWVVLLSILTLLIYKVFLKKNRKSRTNKN